MIGIYKLTWCITLFVIHHTGYTGNTNIEDTGYTEHTEYIEYTEHTTGIYTPTLDTVYILAVFNIINAFSVFLFESITIIHTGLFALSVLTVFLLTHKPTSTITGINTMCVLCIIYTTCIVYMLTTILAIFFKKIHDVYLSYISSDFCYSCRYSEEICVCPKNFYSMKPDADTYSIASSA